MYEWKDVLIIGDSFAGHRVDPKTDWPSILTQRLTGNTFLRDPRGKGFVGSAWWSVRTHLLKQLKESIPKVLILVHTEPMRLPSDNDLALNVVSVSHKEFFHSHYRHRHVDDNLRIAADLYYKYLQSKDFHLWSQEQWFKELDEILDKHQIPKVVHFHAFLPWDPKNTVYTFRNGITFDTPLWEISDDVKLSNEKKAFGTDHRNHFSIQNNIILANVVYDALNSYSDGLRKLTLD